MGRDNKYLPQSYDEIVADAEENKSRSKIYRAESMELSDDRIAISVANISTELALSNDKKLDLVDTESVKARTMLYLKACEQTSAFPTISGLARSFGMSRNSLYQFMNTRPSHETSKWLDMVRDSFAEILEQNSLRNNCNSITSIFLLKASYGYRESLELVNRVESDITNLEEVPIEEIKARYDTLMKMSGDDDVVDVNDIEI